MHNITKVFVALALTGGMAWAEPQDGVNLFENPGKKQTDKDFKPAPAKIETHFGSLGFINGAYPDEESTQRIYDEMDLQRATQAYLDFYPTVLPTRSW